MELDQILNTLNICRHIKFQWKHRMNKRSYCSNQEVCAGKQRNKQKLGQNKIHYFIFFLTPKAYNFYR
eukprot:3968559-Ditylum_brightwellii.AAC.1